MTFEELFVNEYQLLKGKVAQLEEQKKWLTAKLDLITEELEAIRGKMEIRDNAYYLALYGDIQRDADAFKAAVHLFGKKEEVKDGRPDDNI